MALIALMEEAVTRGWAAFSQAEAIAARCRRGSISSAQPK